MLLMAAAATTKAMLQAMDTARLMAAARQAHMVMAHPAAIHIAETILRATLEATMLQAIQPAIICAAAPMETHLLILTLHTEELLIKCMAAITST